MKKDILFSVTKKDLTINYFSGRGAGGQNRNKNQNCIRLKHEESGAMTTGQSHKERKSNMKEAFNNLAKHPKFRIWCSLMINEKIDGKSIEEKVNEMMEEKNLKIEERKDGKWKDM